MCVYNGNLCRAVFAITIKWDEPQKKQIKCSTPRKNLGSIGLACESIPKPEKVTQSTKHQVEVLSISLLNSTHGTGFKLTVLGLDTGLDTCDQPIAIKFIIREKGPLSNVSNDDKLVSIQFGVVYSLRPMEPVKGPILCLNTLRNESF